MIYINTRTGAIVDSPCNLSGDDWALRDDKQTEIKAEETKIESKPKPKRTTKKGE